MPALLLATGPLALACDSPPQIVDISPGRGAQDVRTNLPIRVRFDRPVDHDSVAARFSLQPEVPGEFSWEQPDTLVFKHPPLDTHSTYRVSLADGYRDTGGHVNGFRHSWLFHTERAPELRNTTPNRGERGVDPSTYLSLNFSRDMLPDTFRDAIRLVPPVPYAVRGDPEDPRRVLLAPKNLLEPNAEYVVSIGNGVTDVDGNRVTPATLHFATGRLRPLTRFITFLAIDANSGSGAGIWMVDESRFARVLLDGATDGFAWSGDGSDLLIRNPDRTWTDHVFGQDAVALPFTGRWAANLGSEEGYAFLDGGTLKRLLPDGTVISIAQDVTDASVSRKLGRIAFSMVAQGGRGSEIWAYDVGLRTQYRLQREPQAAYGLRWDPAGARLAYIVASAGGDAGGAQLRVKSLTGLATATTVATGEIADPTWLGGLHDLVFTARVDRGGARQWRIFRVNPSLQPVPLQSNTSLAPIVNADTTKPVSSPDGHQVAFLASDGNTAQVWLMNADGTGAAQLTHFDAAAFPYSCEDPHWSS